MAVVFVTGWITKSHGKDIFTASLTANGAVTWWRQYNNPLANGDDHPVTIAWDNTGYFIYVGGVSDGTVLGGGSSSADFVLLKYNQSDGTDATGWGTPFRYNGTANGKDSLADVAVVHQNIDTTVIDLLYVAGTVRNIGSGQDYATIWINPANPGNYTDEIFNSSGSGDDVLTSLAVDAQSQTEALVVVTGYSNGEESETEDYVTIAYPYDLSVKTWGPKVYDGTGNGSDRAAKVVIELGGGSVFVTGESWGGDPSSTPPGTGYDFVTIRYAGNNGDIDWTSRFDNLNANAEDRAADLVVDKFGNTYVGGKSYNGVSLDYCAISYDISGATRWIQALPPNPPGDPFVLYDGAQNGSDVAGCIRVSSDGGPFIDHDGDVFLYGLVSRSGSQFTVVKYTQTDVP